MVKVGRYLHITTYCKASPLISKRAATRDAGAWPTRRHRMWPEPSDSEPSSSEDEAADRVHPLPLSWLDLSVVGHPRSVAVSGLPGGPGRQLAGDLDYLAELGVTAVLLLCPPAELAKLGVAALAERYAARGMAVCQRPVLEGEVPDTADLLHMFDAAVRALEAGGRVLLHCSTGLGRACTVAACLLLHVHEELSADDAVECVRQLRGPRAVQSVRQFNFIQEYREARDEFVARMALPESRPVSR